MIEENVVSSAGTVYHLSLEQIRRAIRECRLHPPAAERLLRVHRRRSRPTGRVAAVRRLGRRAWPAEPIADDARGGGRPDRPARVSRDPGRASLQVVPRLPARLGRGRRATSASSAIPGAIFGLLGPNGAGKTTTLRILSTVLRPTGGRAVGRRVRRARPSPRRSGPNIGYMSASTGHLRPDDRLGAGRVLRPALRPDRATGSASGWRRSSTGSR